MYIFNPEHDLCLANGDIHFVPPRSALAFGRDCASLTKFMQGLDPLADSDNLQYSSCIPTDIAIKKIVAWGWDSVLRTRLLKEGFPSELLPSDQQLKDIANLSHRQVALDAHAFVSNHIIPDRKSLDTNNSSFDADSNAKHVAGIAGYYQLTPADYRIAATTLEQVEVFLQQHTNIVLKAPLSGSGKGIRFVSSALSHSDSGWCRNLIQKHGYLVVERRFTPVLECAMLFECTNNNVSFKGYSLFYANNGMYSGNILASNEFIENEIVDCLSGRDEGNRRDTENRKIERSRAKQLAMLERVKGLLMEYLQQNVAPRYNGFVGVDQFVYKSKSQLSNNVITESYYFNPVVEINLRMTMGLLARNIYDRFANEFDLQDGSHCFEIIHGKSGMNYRIESMHKEMSLL